MDKSTTYTGFAVLLSILLASLKLDGALNIGWTLVTCPMWAMLVFYVSTVIVYFILKLIKTQSSDQ